MRHFFAIQHLPKGLILQCLGEMMFYFPLSLSGRIFLSFGR